MIAIHEEQNQFERNKVWFFVPSIENHSIIGTKLVFKNKLNKYGEILKNKARLVVQGYCQEEGINFNETFEPVARLESIWMMLDFAYQHDFADVKSASLNKYLKKESMSSNLHSLKIQSIRTMCSSFIRHYMA